MNIQERLSKMSLLFGSFRNGRSKASQLPVLSILIPLIVLLLTVHFFLYSSGISSLSHFVFNGISKTYDESHFKHSVKENVSQFQPLRFEKSKSYHMKSNTGGTTMIQTHIKAPPTTTAATLDSSPVDTVEGCLFQDVDAFDPKIKKYIKKHRPISCSQGLPTLVYIDNEHNLRVNFTKLNATVGSLDYCKYTRVELSDEDDSHLRPYKWSEKFLRQPVQLSNEDEHIFSRCYFKNRIVSQTFKSRVLIKPKVEERSEANYKRHKEEHTPMETMSVLIIGIDAMSKENLARAMPKTRNFIINKLNAKELNKFNKLGYNTFSNVVVLHTGYNKTDLKKVWSAKQFFDVLEDRCIWHHYQNAGYRTGMGFDVVDLTAYHYLVKGWKKPTFDYYSRTLRLAIEKAKTRRNEPPSCVGEIPELNILMDHVIQMVSLFKTKTKPYFIYNFYTKLSHDNLNLASAGDDLYLNLFQELDRKNALKNTITIFFSDHGPRFGRFRWTFNGKIETNTPFAFFMFPPWFEKKYPQVMKTFQTNQNRLTTLFDINKMLMDLLTFDGKTRKGSLDSRAISLFDEIPRERTCEHAAIPLDYCNCKRLSNEKVSDDIKTEVSRGLVAAVVNRTKDIRNICALLSLKEIKSVYPLGKDGRAVPYYQVTLTTEPGGGVYEAIMKYNKDRKKTALVGDINRLNLYRGQDACVDKRKLKLFCFCTS